MHHAAELVISQVPCTPVYVIQCDALQGLDAVLPLALFIAHERSKGKGSFWQPYLGLLPENPGCAWLMGPEELQQALQTAREQLGMCITAQTPA